MNDRNCMNILFLYKREPFVLNELCGSSTPFILELFIYKIPFNRLLMRLMERWNPCWDNFLKDSLPLQGHLRPILTSASSQISRRQCKGFHQADILETTIVFLDSSVKYALLNLMGRFRKPWQNVAPQNFASAGGARVVRDDAYVWRFQFRVQVSSNHHHLQAAIIRDFNCCCNLIWSELKFWLVSNPYFYDTRIESRS